MRIIAAIWIITLLTLAGPAAVAQAQSPNLLVNPGFEGSTYKTETVGTSLSSNMVEGWMPWSVLGDARLNREVEYKVIDASASGDWYRVHGGSMSQKFFTTWGTHTAGMYQRVRVPAGSKVVFSIWVQIYSGERDLVSNGEPISDLEWPRNSDDRRGPGMYRASVGIDPQGNVPGGFGAPPSDATVWSAPVTEFDTRREENGVMYDAWVQLEVSTIAQGEWVTVYTRGMPEFAVKHNDSFWDDASLISVTAPTATPRPTDTPTDTPIATDTPEATATPVATETPIATSTPEPTATSPATETPEPTATEAATATPEPSATPLAPTEAPTLAPTATPDSPTEAPTASPPTATTQPAAQDSTPAAPTTNAGSSSALFLYIGGGVIVAGIVIWLLRRG